MTIHLHMKNFLYFIVFGVIVGFILLLKYNSEHQNFKTLEIYFKNTKIDSNKFVFKENELSFGNNEEKNNHLDLNQDIYDLKSEWFFDNCLKNLKKSEMTMENLQEYLNEYYKSSNDNCKKVFIIFNSMFELQVLYGEVKLNDEFKLKVKKWLDNKEEFLNQALKQKIIKLYNKYHHDEMIYNGIRGKRPQPKQMASEKNYTLNLLKDSLNGCDFCENNYKTNTASEILDRIETKLTYTAANTFKYDKWHSLIVSRNHDTLFMSEDEIVDMFSVTSQWFEQVNTYDSSAKYPEAIWDAMPKSGASQVHTHLQASMGIGSYYGVMRRWLDASQYYFRDTKRDFMDDFILIHRALGLVYETNNVLVIVNLIPLKDQEIMLIANNDKESSVHLSKLMHRVIRVFVDKLEMYSFCVGMYWPEFPNNQKPQENAYHNKLEKIFYKILFRSAVTSLRSDFNGLDLYTSSVISVDRYNFANKLFQELATSEKN